MHNEQDCKNYYTGIVKTVECDLVAEQNIVLSVCMQERDTGNQCVHYYTDNPELYRSQFGISQSEFLFQMSIDAHIYRHHQIDNQYQQGQFKIHQSGKPNANKHDSLIDSILSILVTLLGMVTEVKPEQFLTQKLKSVTGRNDYEIYAKLMRAAASRGFEKGIAQKAIRLLLDDFADND